MRNPNFKKALTGLAGSWGRAPHYLIPSKSQHPNSQKAKATAKSNMFESGGVE